MSADNTLKSFGCN